MTKIHLVIDGAKGDAVERFAALAGKSVDELILSWIKDKVDHAVVVSMRAGEATWEVVAAELGVSITQARRIYADGSEFQPVGKEDVRSAEKYLKVLEEIRDITREGDLFPTPSQEDIDLLNEYNEALPDPDHVIPGVSQEDIDLLNEYNEALPDTDINLPVPSEEDIEAVERYSKATRGSKKKP
jgi:hypothetical protein